MCTTLALHGAPTDSRVYPAIYGIYMYNWLYINGAPCDDLEWTVKGRRLLQCLSRKYFRQQTTCYTLHIHNGDHKRRIHERINGEPNAKYKQETV